MMIESVKAFLDRAADDTRGAHMTQAELCEALAVSRVTIHKWQREGLPYVARKGSGAHAFHIPTTIRWMRERYLRGRVGDAESAFNQLARARTAMVEMDIAQRRLEVARRSDIDAAWNSIVSAARTGMMTLSSIAPQLEATPGIAEKADLIEAKCYEILTRLANGDWMDDDAPTSPDEPHPVDPE